jgi:GntR family transcriptional regulator, transcriptional repressor for pyruvate dehydrogenase complex
MMALAARSAAPIRRPSVVFSPIRQPRAHEYVAEQVRRYLALRLIPPGEALPSERELVAMFGVGRPTIQQALRMLEAEHLVEARRGRAGGTFVLEPTEDARVMEELTTRLLCRRRELGELLDHRRVLEPAIAKTAARSRRSADLQRMRRALGGMGGAASEPDYMYFDTEFHMAVAAATHNRFFSQAIEQIRMELNDALSLLPESEAWHSQLASEHEAVFAAVEGRDAAAAEAAADLHVANSNTGVRAVLTAIRRSMARGAGR